MGLVDAEVTAKEKVIHEQGLVSVLKQLHDELDAAVFDAYGLPHDLTDEQILERLVALNQERAEEERRGIVRWLRPDFQAPESGVEQQTLGVEPVTTDDAPKSSGVTVRPAPGAAAWPKKLTDRIVAIRELMAGGALHSVASAAGQFKGAPKDEVEEILQSLAALGHLIALEKDGATVWAAPGAARQSA